MVDCLLTYGKCIRGGRSLVNRLTEKQALLASTLAPSLLWIGRKHINISGEVTPKLHQAPSANHYGRSSRRSSSHALMRDPKWITSAPRLSLVHEYDEVPSNQTCKGRYCRPGRYMLWSGSLVASIASAKVMWEVKYCEDGGDSFCFCFSCSIGFCLSMSLRLHLCPCMYHCLLAPVYNDGWYW